MSQRKRKRKPELKPASRRSRTEIAEAALRGTAYHEAGHAVASHRFAIPFTRVHINPQQGLLGVVERGEHDWGVDDLVADEKIERIENQIAVSFSGVLAEAKYAGRLRWKGSYDDLKSAFEYATFRDNQAGLRVVLAHLKYMWEKAIDFIEHPAWWDATTKVAEALIVSRQLDRSEVSRFVGEALSDHLRRDPSGQTLMPSAALREADPLLLAIFKRELCYRKRRE